MEDLKNIIRSEYIKCANEPVHFLKKYCKIQHPQRGGIPFHLYPFQEKVLNLIPQNPYNLILKSRQLGISTLVAGYSLWFMLFHENKNILCIATKQNTAKNMVTKVSYMYNNLPSWLKIKTIENNKLTLSFNNGSKIQATSSAGDAGRSEAVSLLILDEAAFIPGIRDIWASSQQTLATGGGCIALSTPFGTGNWFHETWQESIKGNGKFIPIKLPWYVHPERNQAWRDEQDIILGDPRIAAQECDCDFFTSGDTVFFSENLKFYSETYIKPPLFKRGDAGDMWVWESPDYTRDYIVVADVARGDGKDNSTFHVIDSESNTQIAEYQGKIGTKDFGNLLVGIATEYNEALLVVENASIGWSTIQTIIDRGYNNLYHSPRGSIGRVESYFDRYRDNSDLIPGISTTSSTRPLFISKFVEAVNDKSVIIQSQRLLGEMETFIWKNGKPEAQPGYNDDLVMAFAIGMYIRDTALVLKQKGIELTKSSLSNIRTTNYVGKGVYSNFGIKNPYEMKVGNSTEDISWLIKRRN